MTRRSIAADFIGAVPSRLAGAYSTWSRSGWRGPAALEARVSACSSRRGCLWLGLVERRRQPLPLALRASARPASTALSRACVAVSALSLSVRRRPVSESSLCALSSAACTAAHSWSDCIALCCADGLRPQHAPSAGRWRRRARRAGGFRRGSAADPRSAPHVALQLGDLGAACRDARRSVRPWSFRERHGLLRRARMSAAAAIPLPGSGPSSRRCQVFAQLVLRDPRVFSTLQAEFFRSWFPRARSVLLTGSTRACRSSS